MFFRVPPQMNEALKPALAALQSAHPDLAQVTVLTAREVRAETPAPLRKGGRKARLMLGSDGVARYSMRVWSERLSCEVFVWGRYAEGLGRWFVASSAKVATGRRTRRSADDDWLYYGLY